MSKVNRKIKKDLVDLMGEVLPDDPKFKGEWLLGLMPGKIILRSRTTEKLEIVLDRFRGFPKWWVEAQVIIAEKDGIIIRDTLTNKPGGIVCREKLEELKAKAKTV